MAVYFNGVKYAAPYRNGVRLNAYRNGERMFPKAEEEPWDGLELTYTLPAAGAVEIGMCGRKASATAYAVPYYWDVYIDGVFVSHAAGQTNTTAKITTPSLTAGTHIIRLVDKAGLDFCSRSVCYGREDNTGYANYQRLTKVKAYGRAYSGAGDVPAFAFYKAFYNCTGLTQFDGKIEAAGNIGEKACNMMFYGCSALTTGPSTISAASIGESGCQQMFYACLKLSAAPELPAPTLQTYAYTEMFRTCRAITESPVLPARTVAAYGYRYMFYSCSALTRITICATNVSATGAITSWTNAVASSGELHCVAGVSYPSGISGLPAGWTRIDDIPAE